MTPPVASPAHLTVARTHAFSVALPLAEAFTLFEPIGEKRWAADWNPVFASPADAALSDITVFTRDATHGGKIQTSIWLITHYDPVGGMIEYRTIVPGLRVSRITVRCRATDPTTTRVEVTYRHASLSDAGDRFIEDLTVEKYRTSIEEWNAAIRAYLVRGTPATP